MSNIDCILEVERGSIVAPAGCGKTHLITEALQVKNSKPILVLTHTTAGVSALKKRLRRLSVPPSHYVVTTIDGWVLKVLRSFPSSCPITSSPNAPRKFYPEIRRIMNSLIASGAIHDILRSSYSRLIVDEYQDCNIPQHTLIKSLSKVLPTVILGDPMQCIFSFAGPMPDWQGDVLGNFPVKNELNTPWRWINAGSPLLGDWILDARKKLQNKECLDLLSCPKYLSVYPLVNSPRENLQQQIQIQNKILNNHTRDSLLVIGSSLDASSRYNFAKGNPRIGVVETVQLDTVIDAAHCFDSVIGIDLVKGLLEITSSMISNVDKVATLKRIKSILSGRNRTPVLPIEQALCNLVADTSKLNILYALNAIPNKPNAQVYRKEAFNALVETVSLAVSAPNRTFSESASIVRERIRHQGDSRIPSRAIGSTLLLKGLEADHCIILDALSRGTNAQHLYVALSRGAKSISIFSPKSKIQF